MAWLLDRDERVRRVLWMLYPTYAVAVIALLALGRSGMLPAAMAICQLAAALVGRRRIDRPRDQKSSGEIQSAASAGEVS